MQSGTTNSKDEAWTVHALENMRELDEHHGFLRDRTETKGGKGVRELSNVLVDLLNVRRRPLRHELAERLAVVRHAAAHAQARRTELARQRLEQRRLAGPGRTQEQCHAALRAHDA